MTVRRIADRARYVLVLTHAQEMALRGALSFTITTLGDATGLEPLLELVEGCEPHDVVRYAACVRLMMLHIPITEPDRRRLITLRGLLDPRVPRLDPMDEK